jgi:excisionase family DNA binding protein
VVTLADADWVIGIAAIGRELGLGHTKAYDLIVAGELPVFQLNPGGYYRARRSDLHRWLEQHRVQQVVDDAPPIDDHEVDRLRELLPEGGAGPDG